MLAVSYVSNIGLSHSLWAVKVTPSLANYYIVLGVELLLTLSSHTHTHSPNRRGRNSIDHFTLSKSMGSPIGGSPGHLHVSGERPSTPSSTTKLHPLPVGVHGRIQREGDLGLSGIGSIGPLIAMEDGLDGQGMDSPFSHSGEAHQANGELLLEGGFGSEKSKPQIDVFSDKAVKIDESGLDQIFASDEEDDSQEVRKMLWLYLRNCQCTRVFCCCRELELLHSHLVMTKLVGVSDLITLATTK